jgi:hypothetical protein
MSAPGRSCPLGYRYRPEQLRENPETLSADVVYVIGGLYGNLLALAEIEAMAAQEAALGRKVELVFNGDFNWFNIDPDAFASINRSVLRHRVVLGNVEWELADPQPGAGCGCAYPDYVGAEVVERSNRIIERLRATAAAFPELCAELREQPRYRSFDLNGRRIVVLHGDPESLAGWGLALENLCRPGHQDQLQAWLDTSGADLIAATHTCSPALWRRDGRLIVNNGSAGMGNFAQDPRGLISRISTGSGHPGAILNQTAGGLRVELVPVSFDASRWQALFGRWWPAASAAALSYGERIESGTRLRLEDCLLVDTH